MKKIFTTFLIVFSVLQSKSQTGNLIFFSEEGYPFRIVMNGVIQNEKPQTNVKVPSVNPGPYKIKVLFTDTALGTIDDKVYMREYYEQTYSIKKVKISDTEKGIKATGQNLKDFMKTKQEADANIEKVRAKSERWSIKMLSANPLAASQDTPTNNQPQQTTTVTQVAPQKQVQQVTTTTTTTPVKNSNVNIGLNAGGLGVGMNVNINEADMDMEQSTTTTTHQTTVVSPSNSAVNMNINVNGTSSTSHTTTTTTQTTTTPQNVYVIPGYSGPYGCGYPMSIQEFNDAKRGIESKSFEDSKFTIAKQICTRKCLLTSQVKEIMLLFTFEQTRLDFAKFAYPYTYDTGNYFKVNDAFTFETSIDDLNTYISGR